MKYIVFIWCCAHAGVGDDTDDDDWSCEFDTNFGEDDTDGISTCNK